MDRRSRYLPNVIAAVIIFVIAGVVAGAIAALVARTMGDTPTGKLVATIVAPLLIMAIATFMILNQLHIAPAIVTITYAVLLGSLGLGMALAFGLGGRETAGQLVSGAYNKAQGQTDQVKHDMQTGKQRAQDQAEHAKAKAKASGDTTGSAPARSPERLVPAPRAPGSGRAQHGPDHVRARPARHTLGTDRTHMSVNDSLANATRAAHDVGLAAWLGGAMFGKFAHNPSLRKSRATPSAAASPTPPGTATTPSTPSASAPPRSAGRRPA